MIHTITKKQAEELEQLADSINQIFFDNNDNGVIYDIDNGAYYTNDLFLYDFRNYIHITRNEYDDNFYQIAGEDDATEDINHEMQEMQVFNANVSFDELMKDLKDDLKMIKIALLNNMEINNELLNN